MSGTELVAMAPRAGTPIPDRLRALFGPLAAQPAIARAAPLIGLIAVAAIVALLWLMLASPAQRPLFAGMADEDKAALVEALGTAGIAHSIEGATGAVTVGESDYHAARMAAATAGLPRGSNDGLDLMEAMPIGASRAVEGERIRASREADLARTIEAMDAVAGARVHLALPEPSAFVRVRSQPAASVMLDLAGGQTLGSQQVQAIVHLVASSVPGLSPDQVAVADQRGTLLSSSDAGADRQRETARAIENDYRDAISAILTPLLGPGNFAAEVSADIDFSQVQSTREGFPAASSALTRESRAITSDPAGSAPGGVPGALANQPPAPATIGDTMVPPEPVPAAPQALRQSENMARDFAVGREISVTQQQAPRLNRLSVAVALRNVPGARARSAADIRQIEALVRGAVGYSEARGDSVEVAARSFAPVTESVTPWWESDAMAAYARMGIAALLVLAFLLFVARPVFKRWQAPSASPAQLALAGAAGNAEGARAPPITLDMIDGNPAYETRAALIRGFVKQDPARAALVVRDLIRTDGQ